MKIHPRSIRTEIEQTKSDKLLSKLRTKRNFYKTFINIAEKIDGQTVLSADHLKKVET